MPSNILDTEVELNKTSHVISFSASATHPLCFISTGWIIWCVFVHLCGLSTVGLVVQEC